MIKDYWTQIAFMTNIDGKRYIMCFTYKGVVYQRLLFGLFAVSLKKTHKNFHLFDRIDESFRNYTMQILEQKQQNGGVE